MTNKKRNVPIPTVEQCLERIKQLEARLESAEMVFMCADVVMSCAADFEGDLSSCIHVDALNEAIAKHREVGMDLHEASKKWAKFVA